MIAPCCSDWRPAAGVGSGDIEFVAGDYAAFMAKKAALLEVEDRHNAKFDKVLAQEEAWIRQGVKARRTRNEGRVRALLALREDRRRAVK